MKRSGYSAFNSSGVLISERGFLFLPCSCLSLGRGQVPVSFPALCHSGFFRVFSGGDGF